MYGVDLRPCFQVEFESRSRYKNAHINGGNSGIRTGLSLVGGERSHRCALPAPPVKCTCDSFLRIESIHQNSIPAKINDFCID